MDRKIVIGDCNSRIYYFLHFHFDYFRKSIINRVQILSFLKDKKF
uniref:Uncharacterized protein n=1 Tax=Myoviridae sp. ctA4D8 TaxID=2823535 RepID=A0A8S5L6L3_9CAUD|nr:MAG TPA: hypothetical protein [Myoviridae sp. ctA4D8]